MQKPYACLFFVYVKQERIKLACEQVHSCEFGENYISGGAPTSTVKPRFTDTRLIRTPDYYRQFAVPGERKPLHFLKIQPAYYGHLIITDSLLCPWGKKALTFSLKSTRLIRTPHYYGQFALSLGKESPYSFPKFNPLNTDIPLIWKLFKPPPVSALTGFDCNCMDHFEIVINFH